MKKIVIFLITVALIIAAGIGLARLLSDNEDPKSSSSSSQQSSANNDSQSATDHGQYLTLEEYDKDPVNYASQKKVYFFHASWCSICRSIDKEITNGPTNIPEGVVLIKTDFDSETDLRQKFGVTTQYTFVQVDESGNEIAQWSATSLDAALAKVKS